MAECPDPRQKEYIVRGIEEGFWIGYNYRCTTTATHREIGV